MKSVNNPRTAAATCRRARLQADRPASVAKNSWWMAECPKHGTTVHMSVIGGNCCECQRERVS